VFVWFFLSDIKNTFSFNFHTPVKLAAGGVALRANDGIIFHNESLMTHVLVGKMWSGAQESADNNAV